MTSWGVVLVLFAAGCMVGEDGIGDTNRFAANGLVLDALVTSRLTDPSTIRSPLAASADGLAASSMLQQLGYETRLVAADPNSRSVLVADIARCALPAGQYLEMPLLPSSRPTRGRVRYYGELGLAPEWRDGACGVACQEWMSSCLLAHANAFGDRIPLSIRGPSPDLVTDADERARYPQEEAAFFGNIFTTPAVDGQLKNAFACTGWIQHLSPAEASWDLQRRICGAAGDPACAGVRVVGPCGLFPNAAITPTACTGLAEDGGEVQCYEQPSVVGFFTGAAYTRPITTFLAKPPGAP